ncbi:MAG TPA: peptide chain release factor N(5)-glutamine methyltransferase [Rhodopila sp.]
MTAHLSYRSEPLYPAGNNETAKPKAQSPATTAEAIRWGAGRLDGIADRPHHEARRLLAHASGLSQNDLIGDPHRSIDTTAYEAHVVRRIAREPLALIVGRREFWSLDFQVSPATLVPRPDSETVIEAALDAFAGAPPPNRILDLGTGTGCLLLALLTEFPSAFGIGLDVAPAAAALARANAARFGLSNRSSFVVSDWTNSLSGRFDLIVANPPYIRGPDIASLMPEVGDHEPRVALDGGEDGYDAYRAIIPILDRHLAPHAAAVLEVGEGQANFVTRLARGVGMDTSCRADLAQTLRAIVLTWPDRKKMFGRV